MSDHNETRWERAVRQAREEVARMERCPDGCGHVVCGLQDRRIAPGETVTWEVQ